MNKKGFTLVELLAVIVVLAIIIVLLGNAVGEALKTAKGESFILQAQTIKKELDEKCVLKNGISQTDIDSIKNRTGLTITNNGREITLQAKEGSKYSNINLPGTDKMKALEDQKYTFVMSGNEPTAAELNEPTIKFTASCTIN